MTAAAKRPPKRARDGKAAAGSRRVALFRGINVGRAKRVGMADLRALFERLGYRDVRTLLNSGNVVFTSSEAPAAAAARIENALASRVGFKARVTVLDAEDVVRAVEENPLAQAVREPARFLLAVLADPADRAKLRHLAGQDWGAEALAVGRRVVYLWCADGILESRAAEAVNRALGDGVTARNWTTMCRLRELAEETGSGLTPP
jgi:uncharacterized protein (DUF1697 family)